MSASQVHYCTLYLATEPIYEMSITQKLMLHLEGPPVIW